MAFPKFDPAKHHRGLLGRFALGGEGPAVQRFRSGGVSRVRLERQYGHDERAVGRRGASASRPSEPSQVARDRHVAVTGKAHRVHAAYAAISRGNATRTQRGLTEYQSPKAIAKARAETGSTIRPKRESMRIEVSQARGFKTPRRNTKRTFTGRPVSVRGYGREYTDAAGYGHTSRHVRNLAGKRR